MLFNSLDFAIFFPIVFALYWLVARNLTLRNVLILVASYTFYGWWDWRFLFLIAVSTIVDFYVGKQMHKVEDKGKRKQLLLVSLFVNLGFLVYFKYTNFFIESFVDSFRLFGNELEVSTLNIILPVGISFYTFQTLSYTIDIYRKQLKPTHDILAFSAFVSFFPQLVAGPIERASHLLPQFYKTYTFNYKLVKSGLLLMAFGLFKKMVIADRAALYVNQVYNNVDDYGGVGYIYATVLFAFQIYCDFSGYSDIAIGLGRTMGFDLMKNFDSPYISKSLTEFWRRWHISLSTWFRDYLYIPLGGNKKGKFRTYANIFIVFVVSGLWHGAALTFIIWGAIHGVILMIEKGTFKIRKNIFNKLGLLKNNFSNHLFFGLIIFSIVCFAWVFFRANSLSDSFQIASGFFNDFNLGDIFKKDTYLIGFKPNEFKIISIAILLLFMFEYLQRKHNIITYLNNQSTVFRWLFYLNIVLTIIVFGIYGDRNIQEFIYFQF
ncbi:MBOAT family O-acyltransferase [Winogradskyella sediminis]|uniref:MBOAT family O-acyltransferase n=1 Tax=Winogradskyella sediminis TaxID=1382466 RepID=UPI000E244396|nr:MBOAT family O-acyltransferase [Winogradskyella sediminis]REG89320.1 D-alanyl-lipoteichoic acid acyltransferase DltB (MBOAT superfamily) [Winogradskyella sediminis]